MENFYFDELVALRPRERNILECVNVEDRRRSELKDIVDSLGGKLCTHPHCSSIIFPGYKRTRCLKCRPPPSALVETPHSGVSIPLSLVEQTRQFNQEYNDLREEQIRQMDFSANFERQREANQLKQHMQRNDLTYRNFAEESSTLARPFLGWSFRTIH